ncbi:ribbon-helix-helix domain-containing protein [Sphingobium sp. DN12]|uniref:ribbon-helix-helix domain-containing protein n=1 Tax=Sphingobium sp. DN12 TaxID=3378073 RepID=UPI003DA51BAD
MSINGTQKKRGRPSTGVNPRVPVRLDPKMLALMDMYCAQAGTSRSDVMREAMALWVQDYRDMLISIGADESDLPS